MPVKLTHFPIAAELLEYQDFQASLDLRSFYYHLAIAKEHQELLGISVPQEDGSLKYFVYTVMAFGLAPAAAVMTRLTKPLLAYAASQGIRISMYLDDAKLNASSRDTLWRQFEEVSRIFTAAGFILAPDKKRQIRRSVTEKSISGFHNG